MSETTPGARHQWQQAPLNEASGTMRTDDGSLGATATDPDQAGAITDRRQPLGTLSDLAKGHGCASLQRLKYGLQIWSAW